MNLPFFAVKAYVPGGGSRIRPKKIRKMPSGRYRYKNLLFQPRVARNFRRKNGVLGAMVANGTRGMPTNTVIAMNFCLVSTRNPLRGSLAITVRRSWIAITVLKAPSSTPAPKTHRLRPWSEFSLPRNSDHGAEWGWIISPRDSACFSLRGCSPSRLPKREGTGPGPCQNRRHRAGHPFPGNGSGLRNGMGRCMRSSPGASAVTLLFLLVFAGCCGLAQGHARLGLLAHSAPCALRVPFLELDACCADCMHQACAKQPSEGPDPPRVDSYSISLSKDIEYGEANLGPGPHHNTPLCLLSSDCLKEPGSSHSMSLSWLHWLLETDPGSNQHRQAPREPHLCHLHDQEPGSLSLACSCQLAPEPGSLSALHASCVDPGSIKCLALKSWKMQSLAWSEFWSEFCSDHGLSFLLRSEKHWGRGRRMSSEVWKM